MTELDLSAINFGAAAGIFTAGWMACMVYIVKPLNKRIEALEARDEANRRAIDEELRELRKKVLS